MRQIACVVVLALVPSLGAAQARVVTPPSSLTIEGMPPIPQEIADGLARYARFRQARMTAWHPTKRQIVITTPLGTVPQFHFVDGPGRDRRQLTWFDRGVSLNTSLSFDPANGNTFVFQYDPALGELRSLYKYDMATGEVSLVTESKSRFPHVWSRQGKWLALDSAERNGRDRDLYVIQPSDPSTKRMLGQFEGPWSPEDWSPDGTMLLVNEVLTNSENYLWRVDVKSGARTPITRRGDGEKAAWANARFSADGKKVYAISDRAGGSQRIWRCEVSACAWTPVTADGLVVDSNAGFELSPDGAQLATVLDQGSSTELHVIDLATLKARPLPAITKGLVSQIQWRPGSREVGFTLASVKSQGDVYSVDTASNALTRWTFSETSFNADVLPSPEVVQWKSFDGTMISGILYRPADKFKGPRPVLVNIHGGPDQRERARWQGRSNYFLNEMGIALLYPNVRGSLGFGRKFTEMDDVKGRDGAVKDIGTLLDWIATRPDMDRERVVLTGASYGGWLALEAGIVYNDRIRGIIEGAGITDYVTYLENTDPARQENRRHEFGDEREPDTRAYLTSISPITRASELKKPTLILHPAKDIRVPVTQARLLLSALKANNATVWYAEFADANHDTFPTTAPNNDWMLAAWIMFLKTFVVN